MKKQAHEFNEKFSKEILLTIWPIKCSTSLDIKEMKIKTALRVHLTPVRMTIFMGKSNNKCW
jgi:hypothetical protein